MYKGQGQAQVARGRDRLGASGDVQFAVQAVGVVFYSPFRYENAVGDFPVRHSGSNQAQDFPFTLRGHFKYALIWLQKIQMISRRLAGDRLGQGRGRDNAGRQQCPVGQTAFQKWRRDALRLGDRQGAIERLASILRPAKANAVSYTHLTLPTSDLV